MVRTTVEASLCNPGSSSLVSGPVSGGQLVQHVNGHGAAQHGSKLLGILADRRVDNTFHASAVAIVDQLLLEMSHPACSISSGVPWTGKSGFQNSVMSAGKAERPGMSGVMG